MPSPYTGDGIAFIVSPAVSQPIWPVTASWLRTRFIPGTMTCVMPPCSTTSGVAQVSISSRLTRHSSSPVRLFRATMNDSFWRYGEETEDRRQEVGAAGHRRDDRVDSRGT
jgi:hypothetical protein